ncbi:unnamed protein product [Heterobilharzia americana]|nr:unnamed protein product [Heterobilharzia americana]
MTSNQSVFDLMNSFLTQDEYSLVDNSSCNFCSSRIQCPNQICSSVSDDLHMMEQHYTTCHHHFCPDCKLSFVSSHLLSIHEQTVHCGPFRPKLDCFLTVCPHKFSCPSELFAHAFECHGFTCDSPVLLGTMLDEDSYGS